MARRKGGATGSQRERKGPLRFLTDRQTARAYAGLPAARYVLRLYTAGSHLRSLRAVETVRSICDRWLAGRAELQIIDLYQQPELAAQDGVVAAPCLIRLVPEPRQVFIGDMSDADYIRDWLGIRATGHAGTQA